MLVFSFKWVVACGVLAVAVAGVAPVTARAEPACRVAPSCSDGQARWQPRGKVDWTIDYSDALTDGTLDAKSAEVHVLPLHIVERAAARQSGKPVTDLKCRHDRRLVCYTNCGAWEAGHWNEAIIAPMRDLLLGRQMDGYPAERWLDIRQLDVMRRLVRDKFASAARLGCDAMVCDNTEAWITGTDGAGGEALKIYREQGIDKLKELAAANAQARTGFAIGYDDQVRYNRMLAVEAHRQCLSIGLINDVFQIGELAADFDFALNEQCHHCGWCDLYRPFVAAGKPVMHLEFADNEGFCKPGSEPIANICGAIRRQGLTTFSTIRRQASSKLHHSDRPERCER